MKIVRTEIIRELRDGSAIERLTTDDGKKLRVRLLHVLLTNSLVLEYYQLATNKDMMLVNNVGADFAEYGSLNEYQYYVKKGLFPEYNLKLKW